MLNGASRPPFWREVWTILVRFLQGQLLVALADGAVAYAGFRLLDVRYALLLGAWVSLMSFVPYLGPVLGFLPAAILAWTAHQLVRDFLGVVGIWAVVQMLEVLVFQPLLLGSKLRLHPLVVILSFIVWGALLGVVGAVLAVPLTAVAQAVFNRLRDRT